MIVSLQALIYFRQSLLNVLGYALGPYKNFMLTSNQEDSDDDELQDDVYAEFDDKKGVVFFPPVYLQRYAAVMDCLMDDRWCGKLEKVVDLGYHDLSFIKYLKDMPGVKCILGVDIEAIPPRCFTDLLSVDHSTKRECPLQITLFQGNAADPDYRLIGCDAVVAIEMIEHMLPHDLEKLVNTVFGFIKPWIAVFTTPNGDFNSLFNALEENGLRRLDHYFEWSREQFHDWCSNIVVRYPQYTVTCKGIGPGPPSTEHLGCCSQMALFISKGYHKQEDLSPNSLVLVSNAPSSNNLTDMIESINSFVSDSENMLCLPDKVESFSDLIEEEESYVPVVLTPTISTDTIEYRDKTSQCNLDKEVGRNFLMFDDEAMYFSILVPRRIVTNRVYEIGDVTSRLNCTNFQVKNFSKKTQNLMEKNQTDSLVHTSQVVGEIKNLTKILNMPNINGHHVEDGANIWRNTNWGENAPYWNQYYVPLKTFKLPFEVKSDDECILELISDKISSLVDRRHGEMSVNVRTEIALETLMTVVNHITDSKENVKELLEWNGYEVVDDVVIYSRVVDDDSTEGRSDTDWDTMELYSNGNKDLSQYYERCLRHTLDRKICKLHTMLTADEEFKSELDRVISRLMNLALRACKGHEGPPPFKWLQWKLLDLLVLTEKAVEKRKRYYIDHYPLKAIDYGNEDEHSLNKFKNNDSANQIMDKYRYLLHPLDVNTREEIQRKKYRYIDLELEDDLSDTSNEFFKESEYNTNVTYSPKLDDSDPNEIFEPVYSTGETNFERTQAWLDKDVELIPYSNCDKNCDVISLGNSEHSVSKSVRSQQKKALKKCKIVISTNEINGLDVISRKNESQNKPIHKKRKTKHENTNKIRHSFTKFKTVTRKRSSYSTLTKKYCSKMASFQRIVKPEHNVKLENSTKSKPIPTSLIETCNPKLTKSKNFEKYRVTELPEDKTESFLNANVFVNNESTECIITDVAKEEFQLMNIIIEGDDEEIICLRRTIGTDPGQFPSIMECEREIDSVINVVNDVSYHDNVHLPTDNVHSQTIFLYDVNEPSTSKGVRHVNMNVQCGTDTMSPTRPKLPVPSLDGMPKMFAAGIKIGESTTDIKPSRCLDFGTSTNEIDGDLKILTPKIKPVGIRIKDSDTRIQREIECSNKTQKVTEQTTVVETKLIKSISSNLKILDSGSEFCGSICSYPKSISPFVENPSDTRIAVSISRTEKNSLSAIYKRPRLSYGGVHVYSCRNKQISEDVVYQGEWQRERSKVPQRKKIYNAITAKKVNSVLRSRRVNSKEVIKNISLKDVKVEQKIPLQLRNARLTKMRQDLGGNMEQNRLSGSKSIVKCNKSMSKIVTKVPASSVSPRNAKTLYTSKLFTPPSAVKGNMDRRQRSLKESNTLHTKKNVKPHVTDIRRLNQSLDSAKRTIKKYTNEKQTVKEAAILKKIAKPSSTSHTNTLNQSLESVKTKLTKNPPKERSYLRKPAISHTNSNVSSLNKSVIDNKIQKVPTKERSYLRKTSISPNANVSSVKKEKILKNERVLLKKDMNIRTATASKLESNFENINTVLKVDKKQPSLKETKSGLAKPDIEESKNDLLKFREEPRRNLNYTIYRNETVSNYKNSPQFETAVTLKRKDPNKRTLSPTSTNNSESSSPSVATVRSVSPQSNALFNREHSVSSHVSNFEGTESETITPTIIKHEHDNRNKKIIKRIKFDKKPDNKDINVNKENDAECSRKLNKNDVEKNMKSVFMDKNKNVFIAELKNGTSSAPNSVSKHKLIRIPNDEFPKETKLPTGSCVPKQTCFKLDEFLTNENQGNRELKFSDNSNMVLVLEPQKNDILVAEQPRTENDSIINIVDNTLLKEWIDARNKEVFENYTSDILAAMRHIVEERLNFIPTDNYDIETLNVYDRELSKVDSIEYPSPLSVKTISNNGDESLDLDYLERSLGRTFCSPLNHDSPGSNNIDTGLTETDFLSFKSITSASKVSDYYLADSELNSTLECLQSSDETPPHPSSVRNIFERKEPHMISLPNTGGVFAIQAFSGLSMNTEPLTGDQPDYVNLIDSETGSTAGHINRKATSEELFVSGRSSETYESCAVEDDDMVPSWLFNVLNPQQAEDDVDQDIPVSPVESMFDVNGNVMEPVVGAGAGDGCGMHSDGSQDSSGRGTSLSSTDTSGQPSEAILMDPPPYSRHQYETPRDADGNPLLMPSSGIPSEFPDNFRPSEGAEIQRALRLSRREQQHARNVRGFVASSDVDADVSSLDTDVPDSSDN